MSSFSRRDVFRFASLGLAASAATGGWLLRADAEPTPASGDLAEYQRYLDHEGLPRITPAGRFAPTEPNVEGPFYRGGAPYRAKLTPPLEPGTPLVVTGRVWSHETRKPIPGATLDLWHADDHGRYDNDGGETARGPSAFKCRGRLITDETGYYECETVRPAAYGFRTPHIHYIVRADGHRTLTTQLFFEGEAKNEDDPLVEPSLITTVRDAEAPSSNGTYQHAVFDIVLPAGS